jgi:hypothetical protein
MHARAFRSESRRGEWQLVARRDQTTESAQCHVPGSREVVAMCVWVVAVPVARCGLCARAALVFVSRCAVVAVLSCARRLTAHAQLTSPCYTPHKRAKNPLSWPLWLSWSCERTTRGAHFGLGPEGAVASCHPWPSLVPLLTAHVKSIARRDPASARGRQSLSARRRLRLGRRHSIRPLRGVPPVPAPALTPRRTACHRARGCCIRKDAPTGSDSRANPGTINDGTY